MEVLAIIIKKIIEIGEYHEQESIIYIHIINCWFVS